MLKSHHILKQLARSSGGTFKAGDAAKAGVHPRDLYALRDEGFLVELSRGVYRLADAETSPYLDLVAASQRSPHGAICLNSALSFWDLTDEIPREVHLAVSRGAHRPVIDYPPVRVHVFAAATFDLGRERIRLDSGEKVSIYSPERSVVDAMRLRNQVGTDVAYEALRRYLRRSGASSGDLLRLARRLRAGGPMSDALEVADGLSEPQAPQEFYRALQRRARSEGRGVQELFEFYLLERFLYRLSVSPYRDRFVLKGGLLLTVFGARRPTRDADVLVRGIAGDEENLIAVVGEISGIPAADGITFDASTVRSSVIREFAAYPGLRISVPATLGTARLQLRLDVNFGDPVGPQEIEYPTLLADEPIALLGYPVEAVIAEKVETMISRGDANTRERDYADVLALSKVHPVKAGRLRLALERTAAHRGTELMPLSQTLDTLPTARQRNWKAFLDRASIPSMPDSFAEAVEEVAWFVDPVLRNDPDLARWNPYTQDWEAKE